MSPTDVMSDAAIRNAIREADANVTLVIKYNLATREIQVGGPFADPVLFMGLLEAAKLQLARTLRRQPEPSIISPAPQNGG